MRYEMSLDDAWAAAVLVTGGCALVGLLIGLSPPLIERWFDAPSLEMFLLTVGAISPWGRWRSWCRCWLLARSSLHGTGCEPIWALVVGPVFARSSAYDLGHGHPRRPSVRKRVPGVTWQLSRPFVGRVAGPTIPGARPRSLAVLASHCSRVSSGGRSIVTLGINELSASPATFSVATLLRLFPLPRRDPLLDRSAACAGRVRHTKRQR